MTEKSGFLGLGAAGGVAGGIAVLAIFVGVLYGMGVLAPAEDPVGDPVDVTSETSEQPDPAPDAPDPAPDTADAVDTPTPVAEATAPTQADLEPEAADARSSVSPEGAGEAESAALQPETEEDPSPATEQPGTDQANAPVAQQEAADGVDEPTEPAVDRPLTAPRFDVVRASPDGTIVIAGQSAPGSTVQILVDGDVADTQSASGQGEFAGVLLLPPSTQARVLTLVAMLGDRRALSADEIIITPTPAPPPVAQAEPDPEPEPEPKAEGSTSAAEALTQTADPEGAATPSVPALAVQNQSDDAATEEPSAPSAPVTSSEPAAVAVLRADEEGVELVQPATPVPDVAPDQVTLETIGYAPEGDVLLSGRAQPDSLIRVYLDNTPRADVPVLADGRWRARLGDIAPGVYALRLDALSEDGAVLSRLETPFKRESPINLASAQPQEDPPNVPAPISQITVQAGDTLWAISRERYGDGLLYVRLFAANRDAIRDPDLIYPGQVFTLPE